MGGEGFDNGVFLGIGFYHFLFSADRGKTLSGNIFVGLTFREMRFWEGYTIFARGVFEK